MEFWAAISIGLFGSLHCLGMCGPIALALPLNRSSSFHTLLGSSLYNLGRVFTYFTIGLLLGSLGKTMSLFGAQQFISIFSGSLIIASLFVSYRQKSLPFFSLWLTRIKTNMSKRFNRTSPINLFLIGALNGLLPCGLVYIALLGALATNTSIQGGFFMLLFGLGTMPMLIAVNLFGSRLKAKLFPSMRKFVPVFIFLIGSLFILRGLGLGVPYVSPSIHPTESVIKCH